MSEALGSYEIPKNLIMIANGIDSWFWREDFVAIQTVCRLKAQKRGGLDRCGKSRQGRI